MKRILHIVALGSFIFFLNCKSSNTMRIMYTDQNNNVFTVTPSELMYDPVTPMESSSGEYSGGSPFRVPITSEAYRELLDLARKIARDSEGKSDKREMLTSVLTLVDKDGRESYILERSEMRTMLEGLLREYNE